MSLPEQLLDTWELISGKSTTCDEKRNGRVGLAFYSGGLTAGHPGKVSFRSSRKFSMLGSDMRLYEQEFELLKVFLTLLVLGLSVFIALFFRSRFSKALDFVGAYANCFLFGIIPPVMAYIHQSKNKLGYVQRIPDHYPLFSLSINF